ncbi:hypothetical protein [Algibacter pacificus]|uniref:hypothetical protein n=1 Tax=Algibacter pacificus TaxID=2599389 RepID=UPI0011C7EFAE|nr:hypothetical protein [Algibacter pacificus]
MKKVFLTACLSIFCFALHANKNPEIGDQFIVNSPTGQSYKYVKFPKLNFLVKKGKLANYKNVKGNKVVVSHVETCDKGHTYVTLKKQDGSKFFGYLQSVKANYTKSLKSGELSAI